MIELATNIGFLVSTVGLGAIANSPVVMSNTTIPMNQTNPTQAAVVAVADNNISAVNPHDLNDVAKFINQYYKDTPILAKIAKCESDMRQFDEKSGEVLRGRADRRDVGAMQINEHYHLEDSKKMGLDIYTLEGNLKYGKYLYNEQGVAPWKASSPCWNTGASQIAHI